MKRSIHLGLLTLLIPMSSALAQDVKYEKYKLDNGLTVILHEDHALPVAAINTWFRVGSKDEAIRRSGFAHLFEHLMFMGTRRVPGNDFDKIMEAGGGANNATTSSDRTNYFASGPRSLLPTLLWLDADRLEDLGRMMDQTKLDKQRDIVRNERRQSYENRPYGKSELVIQDMLYPVGHRYHIPTIGTHEDLEAALVTDVKDFFAMYYVPNNASLVVAGDFDPAVIKPMIANLFGTLPRGQDAPHASAGPVQMDAAKRATMMDKVQLARISFAYHAPPQFAEGDAETRLAARLLADGKTSRLYKRLVYQDKIAVDVRAAVEGQQYGSVLVVDATAAPGADLDRIEKTLDEELARIVADGPTAEELERHKATTELAMLARLESIEARADQLNEYEYFWGEPNSFKRDLDRFRNATAAGVRDWCAKVLLPHARVITRVLPEAPPVLAESPRDKQPAALDAGSFTAPAPQTTTLSNGMPIMVWTKRDLPMVELRLVRPLAGMQDLRETAGLSYLAASMLSEGAGDLDALAFEDAISALGASFDADVDRQALTLSLTSLRRSFERSAALFADAVRRPRFDAKEWERVQRLHSESLRQQDDQPAIVAARVAARQFFGEASPYGWPVGGTVETVAKLTLDGIKAAHARLLQPTACTLLVAGDISADEAKSTLDRLFDGWNDNAAAAGQSQTPVTSATPDALRVVIVNRPEAVQTVLYFIMPGPKYADDARVPYRLLNTVLGGSFSSRLNMNLREDKGYTYGARSRFAMDPDIGYFTLTSSVRADVTGKSVDECLKEIKRMRGGDISPVEATKAAETLRTDVIQSFAGLGGILATAQERLVAKMPFDTLAKDMQAMAAAKADQLNAVSKAAIPLEHGVLVLVGDRARIREQLKPLGLPEPVEVTPRGDLMK